MVAYLEDRGLTDGGTARAVELPGGVSNTVLLIEMPERRWVLKQSLARLKVADEWIAWQGRILTEARALGVAGRLAPQRVPSVVDVDADSFVIVIEAAPEHWENWKTLLLRGQVDTGVGRLLGETLASFHAGTAHGSGDAAGFDDVDTFEQLRVDPYYRTICERVPDVRGPVEALIERMLDTRSCVVHGDFSPKNVLTGGGDDAWVLDWEVAHLGDPAFDIGFLSTHLVLKAIHARPALETHEYRRCLDAFWSAYSSKMGSLRPDENHCLSHLGALLVSRTDGKSPAEYLDTDERAQARALGSWVLHERPATFGDVWEQVG